MSVFDRLGHQHGDINELFRAISEALSMRQLGVAHAQFGLAANKLIACMRAEHAVVFPRLANVTELVGDVVKARRQHETIEDSINLLRIGGLPGDTWTAQLKRLIHLFGQNVSFKELSLFPIAGRALMPNQLRKIGVDFAAHLAHAATVAGATITYEPAPVAPRPVAHPKLPIRFDLGRPYDVIDLSSRIDIDLEDLETDDVIDLATGNVIDPELDEIANYFDRPIAV